MMRYFRKSKANNESGFTIIEVLVATAVMSILATSLMMMIEQINRSLRVRLARADQVVDMHVTSVAIESQLRRMFLPGVMTEPTGSGWVFEGEAGHNFETILSYNDHYSDCSESNFDKLQGHESLAERNEGSSSTTAASDRRSVILQEHKADESVVIRECSLRRRVRGHDQSQADNGGLFAIFSHMGTFQIGNNIDYFQLRFYDSAVEEWKESWDSSFGPESDRMPTAIEYAFRVFDPNGQAEPDWFRGMVRLQ